MPLNNRLEVISPAAFEQIHDASITLLEGTGVRFHHPEALALFQKSGARVAGETVYLSREMIAAALASCPSTFTWTARNPRHSVTVGEGFLVQPNVGPVFIKDMDHGRRPATLSDYANIIKLCQAAENVHLNGTLPVDPADLPAETKYLQMMQAVLRHTDKPVIGFCAPASQVQHTLEMAEIALDGQASLEHDHCLGVLVNPLSPLGYAGETVATIMAYARRNQIILLAPCIMAGVSGPVTLLGTSVLQNTEILAGIVLTQLTRPGAPVVYATASTVGYMKDGSFAAGSPEAMLINAPNLQMGRDFYHLPTRTMCGITHAKEIDCQAGYETMMSLMMGVLSGANIGVQCLGTLDALMTISYEKMIIDQEMISRVLRVNRGIEVTPEDLAVAVIRETGPGGNYLMHPTTFDHCRDYWMPTVADWESHDTWLARGAEDPVSRANRIYKETLAQAPETLLNSQLEATLETYVRQHG